MRLEDALLAGYEIVGIVLAQGAALGFFHASSHNFDEAHHSRRLPIALRAEAVALLHEPLYRKRRKFFEVTEVTKVIRECIIVVLFQEALNADFLTRLDLNMTTELLGVTSIKNNVIGVIILISQRLNIGI